MNKEIEIIRNLGIDEFKNVDTLCDLPGDYINVPVVLPNGKTVTLLDDNKIYKAYQCKSKNNKFCYGVAIDDTFAVVYTYCSNGRNPKLLLYKNLD